MISKPVLNLVVIRAADPEASVAFYQLLGLSFTKHRHGAGPEHYAAEDAVVFEIYPRGAGEVTTATRLGFRVADLDAVIKGMLLSGTTPIVTLPALTEWGYRAVVQDPDGHKVELVQGRDERAEFQQITQVPGAPPPHRMFS
jgi:catechol 2,3-dioxygenase-like lactoylglutathione lyase family enzyme